MKKYIELDEMDLQQILSEKFSCLPSHVNVEVVEGYAGYGFCEQKTHKVKVTIKQEEPLC